MSPLSRAAKAVLLLAMCGAPWGAAYAGSSDLLAWPPPKLNAPKRIALSDGNDNLDLDSRQDYILEMPKGKKVGHVRINGGRNVVLIGGWSTIPAGLDHQDVNFLILDKPESMVGRIVHVEGVKVDGSGGGSSDAFHINAPRAIVQLENIRATGIIFNPQTRWHSDLIQPGGGCKELRVDRFSGSSQFQGFYLAQDRGPIEKLDLRHVNLWADGTRKIVLLAIGGAINSPKINGKPMFGLCDVPEVNLQEVYLKPSAGQDATAAVLPSGGKRNPTCQAQLSADGKTLSWPNLQHKISGAAQIGDPPAGDFVAETAVGLGYRPAAASVARSAEAAECAQLTENFRQRCLSQAQRSSKRGLAVEQNALELARSLRPDGSWGDVDYGDQTRGSWRPYLHLMRVASLVRSYKRADGDLAGNPQLKAAIHRALAHWLRRDYQCPNWWYNQIGVPMLIGEIGILLQDELTTEEYELAVNKVLPRAKLGMTGQNRVWLASNTLVRGLLRKDESLIRQAADVITEEIRITTREGVQPDFSFHQHGPQQQFGNYGLAFAGSAATWAQVFSGTPFAIPRAKLDIIHDYLLEGESWVVWCGRMDLSSCGRQLAEGTQVGKAHGVAAAIELLGRIDAARASQYQACLKRNTPNAANDLIGNRHFWRSDYMIQRGSDYYASVKMCSRRVIGGEEVNSENISGYHLADGALLLYRTGSEYEDIQPVWDWQKIPGTTAPQRPDGPPRLRKRYTIASDFVGGVSDGISGCAAVDFTRDGLHARKAYFFLRDAIICLGAAVEADSADPVVTTINQCLLSGKVWAGDGKVGQELTRGEHHLHGPNWLWHDGIGYVFPDRAEVTVRLDQQRGSWRRVEDKPAVSTKEVRRDVFLLTIDHGVRPKADHYAYLIFPHGTSPASMPRLAGALGLDVLANTPRLQAVRSADNLEVQAVFYEPGELDGGQERRFAADQPCMAMLKGKGGVTHLTIADPTEQLREITLPREHRRVPLPQGGEAGKSVTVDYPWAERSIRRGTTFQ